MAKLSNRLCSKCWAEIDDLDEEASYLGITKTALIQIREFEVKKKRKYYRVKPKVYGNKYVKHLVRNESIEEFFVKRANQDRVQDR